MTLDYKLHLGDSAQVLKTFDAASIDLTVTSPPYDNLRTYDGYTGFDFETIAQELYRVTKPGGVVVWVVGDATINGSETGTSFRQALYFMGCGFNMETMIYQKAGTSAAGDMTFYLQTTEYMFIFSKGRPATVNILRDRKNITAGTKGKGRMTADGVYKDETFIKAEFGRRFNVWTYSSSTNDGLHPAPFPEALAGDHILSWSNPGDIVLDCFLGSGTTGKMAMKYGRNFVGIEVSAKYLAIAEQRIRNAAAQPLLFEAL
jgi:site-specific DNA-methyltransferase (adenine-specific)